MLCCVSPPFSSRGCMNAQMLLGLMLVFRSQLMMLNMMLLRQMIICQVRVYVSIAFLCGVYYSIAGIDSSAAAPGKDRNHPGAYSIN